METSVSSSVSSTFKTLSQEIRKYCEEGPSEKENIDNIRSHAVCVALKHEKSKIVSLQDSLDQLHTQRQLAQMLCKEMDQIKMKEVDINNRIDEIESLPVKPNTHDQQIEAFKEYCGLSLKSDDNGCIVFVFTNIDPNDHNRQFSVNLSVQNSSSETSEWTFLEAEPYLDQIPQLISELNKTNDLHLFCLKLRKLYKQNYCV